MSDFIRNSPDGHKAGDEHAPRWRFRSGQTGAASVTGAGRARRPTRAAAERPSMAEFSIVKAHFSR